MSDSDFNSDLIDYLKDHSNHANFYDLYTLSEDWNLFLHNALKGRVVRLSRSHYIYNESRKLDYSPKLPIGFEIRSINKHYYNTYKTNIDSIYGLLWESDNEYIEKAFGFSILTHGEFASVCNTFFIGGGFIAPDILNLENYRKMGLPSLVCSCFIKESQ